MEQLQPLSVTEQTILLHEIKRVGIPSISDKLTHNQPYTVELQFYLTEVNNNPTTQRIFDAITIKEKKDGYNPKGKVDMTVGDFIQPNNILGYYTHYWHGEDAQGKFIKCTSNFIHKEVLEKILTQLKKTQQRNENSKL